MPPLESWRDGVELPARTGQEVLGDGRRLAWAEWGADGAPAVLFCAGAATGRRLGFVSSATLDLLGIRLVSVDRPGVGSSDPLPSRTLLDWPADVRALTDQRDLDLVGAVGFSQGAPFALACGAAGLVPAVAFVSGTDELASPAFRDHLPPDVLSLVDSAAADPTTAEAHFAGAGDAVALQRLVHAMSSARDREVYGHTRFATAPGEALRDGLAEGAAGYARDVLITLSPWPFAAEGVMTSVDLWYGRDDSSPVHSPDLGATLGRRLPRARRHVLPDEGGAILWTRAEQICRALLADALPAAAAPGPPDQS